LSLTICDLAEKDFAKAIRFAVTGMHFERYTQDRDELAAYGKYFLYMEMERATQVLAAYDGDRLAGVLMADMKGEEKKYRSLWRRLYVAAVGFVMKIGFGDSNSPYDKANRDMFDAYRKTEEPDGEICFLAADPDGQGKGTGGALLAELARREAGKTIYLYTDENCTYQFYERKGFRRVGEKDIRMDIHGVDVPLTCMLYAKKL